MQEQEEDHLRQANLGKYFNVESEMLDSQEVSKNLFPLLNPDAFRSALYCPGDGVVDPAMLCNALKKFAIGKGSKIFEECPAIHIQTEEYLGQPSIRGVVTPYGNIQTKCIINCTGVWALNLAQMLDIELPIVPMRHAYVVSNSIKELRGAPSLRDNEASIYFRIQGESICLGGYEDNPEILKEVGISHTTPSCPKLPQYYSNSIALTPKADYDSVRPRNGFFAFYFNSTLIPIRKKLLKPNLDVAMR